MRLPVTLDDPKHRIGAAFAVSIYEPPNYRIEMEHRIHDQLRMQVADKIARDCVVKHQGNEHITYRLDLYVHTAEELIELINRQALELSRRMTLEASFPR